MHLPPIITGVGLMTTLGPTPSQTWGALLAGRSISDHAKIPGITAPDRAGYIAQTVAAQAIEQAHWTREKCADESTALIVATSKGPIESWLAGSGPGANGGAGVAQVAQQIAELYGFSTGPRLTFSAACASGLHALIRGAMMIAYGEAHRVLVVAAEASVHPLFISSFRRLGVLAPEGFGCRPFDTDRRGFVMSEAGAAICLEALESNAATPLAAIDRYAIGGDAIHLTAGDPQGLTLRRLLSRVFDGRGACLIHAHGTATTVHDPVELAALESALPQAAEPPAVYSHKAALGHSLGAAGLVSIVLNCLAHQSQIVPPNIRSFNVLPTERLRISPTAYHGSIRRSLAIATGFGGPSAVVSMIQCG